MDTLIQYSIPVKGLRNGVHEYEFHIDRSFFEHFEGSPVSAGNIQLQFSLDKRPDMQVLEFDFVGTVKTECDRCLVEIDLPISGKNQLIVKLSADETLEEAEVIFIHPETQRLNIAKYVYEFIILALPIIKVYDCRAEADPPCDETMLAFLQQESEAGEEEAGPDSNPIWDELKKLKDN